MPCAPLRHPTPPTHPTPTPPHPPPSPPPPRAPRYNEAVGPDWAIAASGSLHPQGGVASSPKHCSTPVAATPAQPSTYLVGQAAEAERAAAAGRHPQGQRQQQHRATGASEAGNSASSSNINAGSNASHSVASGAGGSRVKAAPDAILGAWLGVPAPKVRRLLSEHPPLAARPWSAWQEQIEAAELLLWQIQHPEASDAPAAKEQAAADSSSSSGSSSSSSSSGGGSGGGGGSSGGGRGGSSTSGEATAPLPLDCSLAADPHLARQARAALASPSTHPAAMAPLAAAANLASFSPQLWCPPVGAALPAIGALLLACPEAWAADPSTFVARCRWLSALAAASADVMADLQQMPLGGLAAALRAPRPAYELLQYLVATRQPQPWAVSPEALLRKPPKWALPAGMLAAYPGFHAWRQGMRSGVSGGAAAAAAPAGGSV
jgi:hypothetical protein